MDRQRRNCNGWVDVSQYWRSDGTYVRAHTRSCPSTFNRHTFKASTIGTHCRDTVSFGGGSSNIGLVSLFWLTKQLGIVLWKILSVVTGLVSIPYFLLIFLSWKQPSPVFTYPAYTYKVTHSHSSCSGVVYRPFGVGTVDVLQLDEHWWMKVLLVLLYWLLRLIFLAFRFCMWLLIFEVRSLVTWFQRRGKVKDANI